MDNYKEIAINRLIYSTQDLKAALAGFFEEDDEIISSKLASRLQSINEILQILKILPPTTTLITIAGPQGTGKSTLVNNFLNLKREEWLPTGLQRAERIPVILIPSIENTDLPVSIKKSVSDNPYIMEEENLSYEEGRKRLMNPKENDKIAFWAVKNNNLLKSLGPIAVSPGYELDAKWSDTVLNIIKLTDIVIHVIDQSRMAQQEFKVLEEHIKDFNILKIAVVTKCAMLSEKAKTDLERILKEQGYIPVFVENKSNNNCPSNNPSLLQDIIFSAYTSIPPQNYKEKIYRIIKDLQKILRKARQLVKKEENSLKSRELDHDIVIENILAQIEEEWEQIKENIATRVDSVLNKYKKDAKDAGRKKINEITRGIMSKVKLFITGGLSLNEIEEIENAVLEPIIKKSQKELGEILDEQLKARFSNKKILEKLSTNLTELSLISNVNSSTTKYPDSTENINAIKETFKEMVDIYSYFTKEIRPTDSSRDSSRDSSKTQEAQNLPEKITITGTIGSIGLGETIAEVGGGGLATGAASSLGAAIAGTAIAVIAALSISSIILRNTRQIEYALDDYIDALITEASSQIRYKLIDYLDKLKHAHIRELRKFLLNISSPDDLQKILNLKIAIKNLETTINDVLSEI